MSRIGVVGGPGHHAGELAAALASLGHSVQLATQYPRLEIRALEGDRENRASRPARLLHDSVRHLVAALQFRLRRRLPASYDFQIYNQLYAQLAARELVDLDALVAFTFVAEPALRAALRRGTPATLEEPATHVDAYRRIVMAEHQAAQLPLDPASVRLPEGVLRGARREYALAPRIHVLSSFARRSFEDAGVPADKIRIIAPGVDTAFFTPTPLSDSSTLRLLFVGRVELAKGIRALLEAMEFVRELDVELVLAGSVTEPARRLLGRSCARVSLAGFLDREQLRAAYRQCHALVFPSLSDGFGLVILEAMASGRAVIGSAASGARDAVRDGVDGWVVPAGDAEALSARIRALVADRSLAARFGAAAASRARDEYSLMAYAQRLKRALEPS